MANTLTDQFQLVKTSTLDANFIQILLGRTVNYNDGFCRELFRDGKHLKSLRSPNDTFSARKGDTMLTVNMGIVTTTFTDQPPTRDGYHVSYDGTARLFVLDARTFAISYVQQVDPLQKTIDVILAALRRAIEQGKHDDMSPAYLRHVVEYETGARRPTQTQHGFIEVTPVVEYGVAIMEAQTMSPRADPERVAEVAEIERVKKEQDRIARDQAIKLTELKNKEVVDTEALRVKDVLAQQQREIDERQRDEALADNRAKWQEAQYQEEQKRLRDAAVDIRIEQARSTAEADARLLNQLRSQGYSTANILQEYPELRYQFEKRDLVSGTLLNGDELLRLGAANAAPAAPAAPSGGSAAATSEPKFGLTREPREDDILTISHLGVTVSHHTLTKEERDSTQIPDLAFAYQVETVVSTGPLRQKLQQADLIYQIGDYPVPEFAKLAPYLDTLQKEGKPARLTYLRRGEDGDLYSDVALLSIPPTRA